MRIAKWIIVLVVVSLLGWLVHYSLPRHEVVRIVGVETRLETFGINRFFYASIPSGAGASDARDVRYLETMRPDGRERVFRNEDTGWGWPPYFKMNSADLQARARDRVSTAASPQWVAISYYGMRSRMLSTYPNAVRLRLVDGPDNAPFPVARTIGLIVVAVLGVWLWVILRRFRQDRLEPFLQRVRQRFRRDGGPRD